MNKQNPWKGLDSYKESEKLYGRDEGNEALQILTKILQNAMNDRDICARLGNDEFVIAGIYEKAPDTDALLKEIKKQSSGSKNKK